MNIVLRNFFYAVGLVLLFVLHSLSPGTAQFKDLVAALNAGAFWQMVTVVAVVLCGVEVAWHLGSTMPAKRAPEVR